MLSQSESRSFRGQTFCRWLEIAWKILAEVMVSKVQRESYRVILPQSILSKFFSTNHEIQHQRIKIVDVENECRHF